MEIGVVRVLALKIPALLQKLCRGGLSRFGLWRKATVAMAERARHVGRLPDASITAPGYVLFCVLAVGCRGQQVENTPASTLLLPKVLSRVTRSCASSPSTAAGKHHGYLDSRPDANCCSAHCAHVLLFCDGSYLVTKGVKQETFTGESWRHGLMVLMFMVAGMVSRRQPDSTEPHDLGRKGTRLASPQCRSTRPRRAASPASTAWPASETGSSSSVANGSSAGSAHTSGECSEEAPSIGSDDAYSDAGTDNTMSAGEEAEDTAPVPELVTTRAEYKAVSGRKPTHDAVLEVVFCAAAMMAKPCEDSKEERYAMNEAEANALSEEAFGFVTKYVAAIFGAVRTTKFHALAYHLLAELLLRANVVDANTPLSEALHKLIKHMWDNTNKQPSTMMLQVLRAEQTLAHIPETDDIEWHQSGDDGSSEVGNRAAGGAAHAGTGTSREGAFHDDNDGGSLEDELSEADDKDLYQTDTRQGSPELDLLSVFDDLAAISATEAVLDGSPSEQDERIEVDGDLSHANASKPPQVRLRVRISGGRTTDAQAAAAAGGRLQLLPSLFQSHPDLAGCMASSQLILANTFKFDARLEWRARPVGQLLGATYDLYHTPWWDHVLYRVPGARAAAKPAPGLARLRICAVEGRGCGFVVFQSLKDVDARSGCALTSFNCRRKKWVIHSGTGFPEMALVSLADVLRLEHVVPDFEDLAERWGMTATPTTVPDSPREREELRFFTNAVFVWTRNSVTDIS